MLPDPFAGYFEKFLEKAAVEVAKKKCERNGVKGTVSMGNEVFDPGTPNANQCQCTRGSSRINELGIIIGGTNALSISCSAGW